MLKIYYWGSQNYLNIFTVTNSSCGKVMFSQACVKNSVHGGFSWLHAGIHTPLGRHPPGQTPPLGRHPSGKHPRGRHPSETANAADGTHPTEMHSCVLFVIAYSENNIRNQKVLIINIIAPPFQIRLIEGQVWRILFFLRVIDGPVLDFWWCLPWIWKPMWVLLLACFVTCVQQIPQSQLWLRHLLTSW